MEDDCNVEAIARLTGESKRPKIKRQRFYKKNLKAYLQSKFFQSKQFFFQFSVHLMAVFSHVISTAPFPIKWIIIIISKRVQSFYEDFMFYSFKGK